MDNPYPICGTYSLQIDKPQLALTKTLSIQKAKWNFRAKGNGIKVPVGRLCGFMPSLLT
jgi:hypothetical protein